MTTRDRCQAALQAAGRRTITTEIVAAPVFYCAEDCHPQYRAKNPNGICVIGGCGVPYTLAALPVGGEAQTPGETARTPALRAPAPLRTDPYAPGVGFRTFARREPALRRMNPQ
jgi:hypothetical protein